MRVVVVHGAPAWDGAGRLAVAMVQGLVARGHEARLAATSDGEVALAAAARGVPVLALPAGRGAWRRARVLRRALGAAAAEAFVATDDEDHLTAALARRAWGGRGAILRRLPARDVPTPGWRGRRARAMGPWRPLCLVGTGTTSDAAAVRVPFGVEEGAVWVSAPGAAPPPPAFAVLAAPDSVRRATPVARAIALLAAGHPTVRLRVLGVPRRDAELPLLAAALGIARQVEVLGTPTEVGLALHGVRGAWVSAEGEAGALAALDAMAHGVPVLAPVGSGAWEVATPGVQGVAVARLDPALMAAEMAVLLADAGRGAVMGAAGRARVARAHTEGHMLAALEAALRGVAA